MKKKNKMGFNLTGLLIIIVISGLGLFFNPGPVLALVNCGTVIIGSTTDTDGDGFTDDQECNGFKLADGTQVYGKASQPPCPSDGTGICLDPDNKDLFVIFVPAAPPDSPMAKLQNPLEFVSNPQASGGLGLNVHIINVNQVPTTRIVIGTQKAVKVTESLDTTSGNVTLGMSSTGTPNGLDNATIYTNRIINFVHSVYGTNVVPTGFIDSYIKHTIAHEVGHMVGPLAPTYNANYGGYHYKSGTNVIMDQSVYYKGTTFYLGNTYTSTDKSKIKLN